MLVLSRKKDEEIIINNITIRVVKISGNSVRLGITAPPDVSIKRKEIADKPSASRLKAKAR